MKKVVSANSIMKSNSLNSLAYHGKTKEILDEIVNNKIDVNIGNYDGRTALHVASLVGNLEVCKLLVKHGANPSILDFSKRTPALEAYDHGHKDILKFFGFKDYLDSVPKTGLKEMLFRGDITGDQFQYLAAASKFAFYFSHYNEPEFKIVNEKLKSMKGTTIERANLAKLQTKLQRDYTTEDLILNVIETHPKTCKRIYNDFVAIHRDGKKPFFNEDEINYIKTKAYTKSEQVILYSFLKFNECCVKTNFFRPNKKCLAFRLKPDFFMNTCYETVPFGLFMMMSKEFVSFHVRFVDIARGGVRIVKSYNIKRYMDNQRRLFDEQYGLANTQQLKNKDIPEGGAKGVILLEFDQQDKAEVAFNKFVNGVLDLILTKEEGNNMIDHYGKEETIFLGPDENTADFMSWACQRAKERGYKSWKGFSTGKEQELGGIPHDAFAMTTTGVHQYVLNILKTRGIDEKTITKCQTGGPDGDLGSNEILISKDMTKVIVDGGGVGYDPKGLDREELIRLAKNRITIDNFDKSKLSKDGFIVTIKEENVTLPDGEFVKSGFAFRNNFHTHEKFTADLFVPCGGRPRSVAIHNVHKFFDAEEKPKFKWIVEGANLFFSDEARGVLEKAGVTLFKDATANKGGVTSSSLEVLCGLALSDEEHNKLMCKKGDKIPEFYSKYIVNVLDKIKENADLEYELIRKMNEEKKIPSFEITKIVSKKANELADKIADSGLYNDKKIVKNVLNKFIPKVLINEIGIEKIMERVPEGYLRAIFGSYLSTRYVYKYGIDVDLMNFYDYINSHRD